MFRLALEERIDLVTSPPLLAELGRVLAEKFEWEPSRVEEAVAQVVETGIVVHPRQKVRVVKDDPSDDRVLEAAKDGGADVIVSGDGHLPRLGSWRGIRIINPSRFVAEFE